MPSVALFSVLAIEEAGKGSILRALAVARNDAEILALWKDFRSHRAKNAHAAFYDYVALGARTLSDFAGMYDETASHPATFDAMKQFSIYVDLYNAKGEWTIPQDAVDESLARNLLSAAKPLVRDNAVSEREIELWIEHMRPAWRTKGAKAALVAWQQAMFEEGLSSVTGAAVAGFVYDVDE